MRSHLFTPLLFASLSLGASGSEKGPTPTLRIFPGYVSKVSCEGKLLVSSVGNDSIIRLEPLPVTLGCAVLIKPLSVNGRTNLVLETSSGSVQATIEIKAGTPTSSDLKFKLAGDRI